MTSYVNAFHKFLSTPSARRATSGRCPRLRQDRYFYPRPPRGGRHASRRHRQHRANFYPRPPRGGRQGGVDGLSNGRLISIHALREEGDHVAQPGQLANLLFLSTPSARRATSRWRLPAPRSWYFYPRPPRGGRLPHTDGSRDASMISIHALREEGDATGAYCRAKADDFYPRPPRGGRPPKNRFG